MLLFTSPVKCRRCTLKTESHFFRQEVVFSILSSCERTSSHSQKLDLVFLLMNFFTVALLRIHWMIWYRRQVQRSSITCTTSMQAGISSLLRHNAKWWSINIQEDRKGVSTLPRYAVISSFDTGCLKFEFLDNFLSWLILAGNHINSITWKSSAFHKAVW